MLRTELDVQRRGRATITGTAGFELELCMARLKENTFVYGYPVEYKFSIMDEKGNIISDSQRNCCDIPPWPEGSIGMVTKCPDWVEVTLSF